MKLPKIQFKWLSKKGEKKLEKPTMKFSKTLINGKYFTCLFASLCSAFIDLVFFSELSRSYFPIAGVVKIPAAILYTIMAIVFAFGKFFTASQLGAISELKNRLKNAGYSWWKNLNKITWKWKLLHRFLVAVSIITSVSLSVVSIGMGINKNSHEISRVSDSEKAISKYSNTSEKSDDIQFQNLVSSSSASASAISTANSQANLIWPIIEDYRQERAEFQSLADFNSTDEIEYHGEMIIPSQYWDKRNAKVVNDIAPYRKLTLNQIRNISSQSALVNLIKSEIEESAKNSSSEQLERLSNETKEKARQEIANLNKRSEQNKITWPSGEVAVFDENDISGTLSLLADIKAAWLNDNGDVGASAKMFMLIGPTLDDLMHPKSATLEDAASNTSVKTFGSTEIMMMVLICVFGIVLEFLIALFTPKSVISRELLYQFDDCLDKDFDVDKFLLELYTYYYKDGIISKKDFEEKSKECVENMSLTPELLIEKFSKNKKKVFSSKVDDSIKDVEEALYD